MMHQVMLFILGVSLVFSAFLGQEITRCDNGTLHISRDGQGLTIQCIPFTPTPTTIPTLTPTATHTAAPTATFTATPIPSTATPTKLPTVAPTALPINPLAVRHKDAGIWGIYLGSQTAAELKGQAHIKGLMVYTSWRRLWLGANTYDWSTLRSGLNFSINQAEKMAFVEVAAGYCPGHEWPSLLRATIAQRKTIEQQGCYPLQFHDPNYLTEYKKYIKELANELARFDSTDREPGKTNILYVRAAEMAETMENLPNTTVGWEASNFTAAPNGRLYNVNLTDALIWAYHKEVLITYRAEFKRAYAAVGLPAPEAVAHSSSGHWRASPNYAWMMQNNYWIDTHVSSPNPNGLYHSFYPGTQTLQTRGTTESAHISKGASSWLAQWQYWDILSSLHLGAEFLGIYGTVWEHSTVLPKGNLSWVHNGHSFKFANTYAGEMRNPTTAPGVWIAFRGFYFEHNWGNLFMRKWLGNYENGVIQTNLPQSTVLYGVGYAESAGLITPIVERSGTPNWGAEFSLCRNKYSVRECEPVYQPPTLLVSAGKYSYNATNLGVVNWCGAVMFCEGGPVTRSEPMLWARQTKDAPVRLDINDAFANSLTGPVEITVTYLDRLVDRWSLVVDGVNVLTVTKRDTNTWRQVSVTVSAGALDIQLDPLGDGNDIFHMVEVKRN